MHFLYIVHCHLSPSHSAVGEVEGWRALRMLGHSKNGNYIYIHDSLIQTRRMDRNQFYNLIFRMKKYLVLPPAHFANDMQMIMNDSSYTSLTLTFVYSFPIYYVKVFCLHDSFFFKLHVVNKHSAIPKQSLIFVSGRNANVKKRRPRKNGKERWRDACNNSV